MLCDEILSLLSTIEEFEPGQMQNITEPEMVIIDHRGIWTTISYHFIPCPIQLLSTIEEFEQMSLCVPIAGDLALLSTIEEFELEYLDCTGQLPEELLSTIEEFECFNSS